MFQTLVLLKYIPVLLLLTIAFDQKNLVVYPLPPLSVFATVRFLVAFLVDFPFYLLFYIFFPALFQTVRIAFFVLPDMPQPL